LHDHIISLREDIWSHNTSLISSFYVLKYLYKAIELSGHVFVLEVSILRLATFFKLYFGNVQTVWYRYLFLSFNASEVGQLKQPNDTFPFKAYIEQENF